MRRFPALGTVEHIPGGYKVKDANGQSLAYVMALQKADADITSVLTMDGGTAHSEQHRQAAKATRQRLAVRQRAITVPSRWGAQ